MSGIRYLPCELHCHTRHSDGSFALPELAAAAAAQGLALIALTDHNTDSGCDEIGSQAMAGSIPVVPGIEWTTDYGHLLVLGARRYVDWRDAAPGNIDAKLAEIREAGGICGIAHPFRRGFPACCGCNFEFEPTRYDLVDYVEVWSEPDPLQVEYADRTVAWWVSLLDRGFRVAAAYGRDWHGPRADRGPSARTFLGFEGGRPGAAGALEALRAGRSVASMGSAATLGLEREGGGAAALGDRVDWLDRAPAARISISARLEEPWPADGSRGRPLRFAVLGSGGRLLWEAPLPGRGEAAESVRSEPLDCDSPYLRLELRGDYRGRERPLAITSAIWLKRA